MSIALHEWQPKHEYGSMEECIRNICATIRNGELVGWWWWWWWCCVCVCLEEFLTLRDLKTRWALNPYERCVRIILCKIKAFSTFPFSDLKIRKTLNTQWLPSFMCNTAAGAPTCGFRAKRTLCSSTTHRPGHWYAISSCWQLALR